MEIIFLNRTDLTYLDHAFLSSEFELIMDIVVYQKSGFVVNKTNINAATGDIVILKDTTYFYIGLIESIEIKDDFQTKIETTDFSYIFDTLVPVKSFSGDVAMYLVNLIKDHFLTNTDPLQNINYLSIYKSTTINGTILFNDDELKSILEVASILTKTYGVRLSYGLKINSNGKIDGIDTYVKSVVSGMKIKSNLPSITNLEITDSNSQGSNKITFYPKESNTLYTQPVSYYLLKGGTVTANKNSPERFSYIKAKAFLYSDNEYPTLLSKAQSELLKSNLEHSIEFLINMKNNIIVPFKNLHLGDFVEFITPSKTYDTMVTQISFKNNFNECRIVLGEYRVKLTDKIKLLERKKEV